MLKQQIQPKKLILKSYQKEAADLVLEKKRFGLFLDMGLGKTVISLSVIKTLLEQRKIKKALIIAPLTVAKNTWSDEIHKWDEFKNLKVSVGAGLDKKARIEALNIQADVYVINSELLKWMYDYGFSKYGMIVIDESVAFKNYKSIRFKTIIGFTSIYTILLSGTPCPNGYLDLWSQIYILDRGKLFGKTFYEYRSKYFKQIDRYGYKWKCINPKEIEEKLKTISISMKSEDYLELPDRIYLTRSFKLPNIEEYRAFEKERLLQIGDSTIVAETASVIANKLLQYCNGVIYDEFKNEVFVHDQKIQILKDIINKYPNDNLLVAYNYISDLHQLQKHFKEGVLYSSDKKADWNKGKIKLMFTNPQSSSEGLNLQDGGHIIIWYGLTWNLKTYLQFNKRLHRLGQTKPVIIIRITSKETVEERMMKVLEMKDATQEQLLEAIKLGD